MDIIYSNKDQSTGEPLYDEQRVFAKVELTARTNNWAGNGAISFYEQLPKGPIGGQTFIKVHPHTGPSRLTPPPTHAQHPALSVIPTPSDRSTGTGRASSSTSARRACYG